MVLLRSSRWATYQALNNTKTVKEQIVSKSTLCDVCCSLWKLHLNQYCIIIMQFCKNVMRICVFVQDKLHFVCSLACSEAFKKANSIVGMCEYCKNVQTIGDIKRVNEKDCCFCSEGKIFVTRHHLHEADIDPGHSNSESTELFKKKLGAFWPARRRELFGFSTLLDSTCTFHLYVPECFLLLRGRIFVSRTVHRLAHQRKKNTLLRTNLFNGILITQTVVQHSAEIENRAFWNTFSYSTLNVFQNWLKRDFYMSWNGRRRVFWMRGSCLCHARTTILQHLLRKPSLRWPIGLRSSRSTNNLNPRGSWMRIEMMSV